MPEDLDGPLLCGGNWLALEVAVGELPQFDLAYHRPIEVEEVE